MKAVILVAGYATRLYPLTKNKPKALLKVGGKTILQHILEKIQEVDIINEVFLVSNARFYPHFQEWVADRPIKVLDDGTSTNETRLGAIADLQFAIEKEKIDDDIIVLAGDNLFDFSLVDFVECYLSH